MLPGFSGWLQCKKKQNQKKSKVDGPGAFECADRLSSYSLGSSPSLTVGVAAEATFITGLGELHTMNPLPSPCIHLGDHVGSLWALIFFTLLSIFCSAPDPVIVPNTRIFFLIISFLHNHILDWMERWFPSNPCGQQDSWLSLFHWFKSSWPSLFFWACVAFGQHIGPASPKCWVDEVRYRTKVGICLYSFRWIFSCIPNVPFLQFSFSSKHFSIIIGQFSQRIL